MEPDRLVAYLEGELATDEHAAVEAALARDAGLRADLEALRRADAALAASDATPLPDGARERLLEALAPAWEHALGDAPTTAGDARTTAAGGAAPRDELAARRRGRVDRRSWTLGLGGAAAAIAAVALVGPVLGGPSGDDAADVTAMSTEEATPDAAFDTEMEEDDAGGTALPVGPTLIGSDRALDSESVDELLAAGELDGVIARGLSVDDARGLGRSWVAALGGGTAAFGAAGDVAATTDVPASTEEADATGDDEAGGGEAADRDEAAPEEGAGAGARATTPLSEYGGPADVQLLGDVTDEDLEAVARCLTTLTTPVDVLVPAFVELVRFDGEPAIAYALVGAAPDGTMTRREVWVLGRADCEVRFLRQG